MSLHPQRLRSIPEETTRVARAAFPHGNAYLRFRDQLGPIFDDQRFAALFSTRGQPAEAPALLALVTLMQFAEGLSDRQAADAVRSRIDWKYLLALELTDPGFDASVLSEFRGRLIAGKAEALLFETLLTRLREAGLLKARGRQRTDSTHVLAAIRTLNRLECVGETLRHTLNTLAVVAPDWLRAWVPSDWFDRYGQRLDGYRLPSGRREREALAERIGADGFRLLEAIDDGTAPSWLREVPAVAVLRRVWIQQYYTPDPAVRWRTAADVPPSSVMISSPYDPDARFSQKRSTEWLGYKVHLTETCDEETPHLITNVETTPATTSDFVMTAVIEEQLAERELLPSEHLVDAGYVTAEQLVRSQQHHDVTLVGPAAEDPSWQAKAKQGYDVAHFVLNWEAQAATCPQGQTSTLWVPGRDRHGQAVVHIRFARTDCQRCLVRAACTQSAAQPRMLTVRPKEQHEALQAARRRQTTEAFQQQYAARAGVEGTISQAVRGADLRRSRYIGLAKTRLHHLITGAAMNLLRVGAWFLDVPRAQTRRSPFLALAGVST